MQRLDTRLDGPILLAPDVFGDERGFFCETYRRSAFIELGILEEMVQDNHSRSRRGVVRGMHVSVGRGAAKVVRCGRGAIYYVLVDVRRGSPTFGQWEGFDLSDENMHLLYAPVGFAHGFCVVSAVAQVEYKCTDLYDPSGELGIAWDDPELAIPWPVDTPVLSPRDRSNPPMAAVFEQLPAYSTDL